MIGAIWKHQAELNSGEAEIGFLFLSHFTGYLYF